MSGKKKAAMITAIVLSFVLLAGGAFAWTDFSQSIINRLRGNADNDVLLHDDFEPGKNKDVYVENTGKTPLVVRVQFREFFQIGNNVLTPGVDLDPGTPIYKDTDGKYVPSKSWPIHKFPATAMTGTGAWGEFDGDCTANTHDFWEWKMTGEQKWYKKGTSAQGNYDYAPGSSLHDPLTCAQTLDKENIMTVAAWNALTATQKENTACWILDADGWCYWSQPLNPGEATNLLLDNVQLIPGVLPDDNYAYFIDVKLQASNKSEIEDMKNNEFGATANGKNLIDEIADRIVAFVPPETPTDPPVYPGYDFLCEESGTNPGFVGREVGLVGPGSINLGLRYIDQITTEIESGLDVPGASNHGKYGLIDAYPLANILGNRNTAGLQYEIKGFKLTTTGNYFPNAFTTADLAPGSDVIIFDNGDMFPKLAPKWEILFPFLDGSFENPLYENAPVPLEAAIEDMRMVVEVVFELGNGEKSSPYNIVLDFARWDIAF